MTKQGGRTQSGDKLPREHVRRARAQIRYTFSAIRDPILARDQIEPTSLDAAPTLVWPLVTMLPRHEGIPRLLLSPEFGSPSQLNKIANTSPELLRLKVFQFT